MRVAKKFLLVVCGKLLIACYRGGVVAKLQQPIFLYVGP